MFMTKSILEELDNILPKKDKDLVLESRASHAISAANHVLRLIHENYSTAESDDLTRRFLLAIKNNNPRKFEVGIKTIKENRIRNANK